MYQGRPADVEYMSLPLKQKVTMDHEEMKVRLNPKSNNFSGTY